ncbi:MAG TPA: aminodeoxychorismate synthase component I [Pyrinomonadaceae bacterium]|nr:aminodeoxychorismate synthase component I [Pyrinomonadaceae bacterium]
MDTPLSALLVFDFFDGDVRPRRACFARPSRIVSAHTLDEVRAALRVVQQAADEGLYAAGYVAYEAAPAFDPALVAHTPGSMPLVWFGLFDAPSAVCTLSASAPFSLSEWRPSVGRDAYCTRAEAAREAIARGDTYQVNYTFRLRARFDGDAFSFYERLRAAQPTPYGAYLNTGRHTIVSVSPELFFRRDGSAILTRPMKGTVRRGRWNEEDAELSAWLAASEKNRAENVMIVDLLRNDLGRVAETGSVHVPTLFAIERYPTVFQMTSTVAARLTASATLEEIFAALFPCGSVTGAPKVSTMRLIKSLEDSPRGVYCGAVGMVEPGGAAVFNVAIRTVVIEHETGAAVYGVGGGVTWDSVAADEYAEALDKAALLAEAREPFELLETLLLADGLYYLLDEHLARVAASAVYFDVPLCQARVREALDECARGHARGRWRVRLLVSAEGAVRVECVPLEATPAQPLRAALALTPVSRHDRFLFHKTTRRAVYEQRRSAHAGVFDVLLWNEEGELTEFTTGNLVIELDGRRVTPPRECGLLAGTLRARLLREGEIEERVLTRADLARATRCWFINGVRGWLEVSFTD